MGIPDHLTCLLRNLYSGQEATVRTGHGTTDWFQIGKGVRQGCILSPCLFNFYAEYITRSAGWKKHKLESRLLGEISITSDMQMTPKAQKRKKIDTLDFFKIKKFLCFRCADDTTLMAESEEELKSLLMKVKDKRKKLA